MTRIERVFTDLIRVIRVLFRGLLMDSSVTRALTNQLADDFGWLEEHCRKRPELSIHAARLRLAAALVRNCLGPFLDGQAAPPLHVVVVGGAGAGKSTVANLLSGAAAAEVNPQAGFTRHPVAYAGGNGPVNWAGHLGFLGPLQRLPQPSPSNLDADVYQVRRVPADPTAFTLLQNFVVWDCPDMTTWAATGYVPRLIEVAGLADVLVYVASDERYNDEVPTQFLHLLLQTGKPVIVCLVKMKEEDIPALVAHFQQEVASKLPAGIVACLTIPHLTPDQLADPIRQAARFRIPLLNQVAVLGEPASGARRRTVQAATRFLTTADQELLSAVRSDVEAMQSWRNLVQQGQVEFDGRYRREYLTGERFRGFDEALVRLMELLELPGVGKVVSGALWLLRTPYRLLRGWIGKALRRPEGAGLPEMTVLQQAFTGWLDLLRKEAARRSSTHPLWAHVDKGFAGGLGEVARDRFQQNLRGFQMALADQVDKTARSIYEELEKNPVMLNTLRGGKLALDLGAIGISVVATATGTGILGWHDLIVAPVAASVTQQLVELLGKGYVDNQRELARQQQGAMLGQYVTGPLAEWLGQWPATGGSPFERLQLALKRIPEGLKQLHAAVSRAMAASGK
jgi:hypothetical protein